jgi:hypothetical protein
MGDFSRPSLEHHVRAVYSATVEDYDGRISGRATRSFDALPGRTRRGACAMCEPRARMSRPVWNLSDGPGLLS